jgi:hypothetical protein
VMGFNLGDPCVVSLRFAYSTRPQALLYRAVFRVARPGTSKTRDTRSPNFQHLVFGTSEHLVLGTRKATFAYRTVVNNKDFTRVPPTVPVLARALTVSKLQVSPELDQAYRPWQSGPLAPKYLLL